MPASTHTPAPSGFNIWQVATGLTTALLVAAVLGLFTMFRQQSEMSSEIQKLKEDKPRIDQIEKDLFEHKLDAASKWGQIDAIKQGIDRLNNIEDQRDKK